MDQPTESISSGNPSSRWDERWFGGPEWWGLPQGAVRAVAVVVVGVLGQYRPQLPTADGYVVLHDLAMPGSPANVDHLVIGPRACS